MWGNRRLRATIVEERVTSKAKNSCRVLEKLVIELQQVLISFIQL